MRCLRSLCAQLVAVLDGSSVPPGAWPRSSSPPPPRESDEEALGRIMRRSRAEATRLKKQGLPLEGAREGRFFYGSAPDARDSRAPDARDSRAGLAVVPELPFLRAVVPQKTTLGIGVGFMRRRGLIPLNAIPTTS